MPDNTLYTDKLLTYGGRLVTHSDRALAEVPHIAKEGLVLHLDATHPDSYTTADPTHWYDLSPYGNDCTFSSAPTFGHDGLTFNGIDNKGTIPDAASLNYDYGDFTILAALEHPSQPTPNANCVLYKGARFDDNQRGYLFMSHAGEFCYNVVSDGSSRNEGLIVPSTSTFADVTVKGYMRRGGRLFHIHNGVVQGSSPGFYANNINSDSVNVSIAFNAHYGNYWAGTMYNILMYNRALTDAEIYNNYLIQI